MKNIVVTGGGGYIGSHMVFDLLQRGYRVFVIDNFSTSTRERLEKIQKHTDKKLQIIEHSLMDNLDDIKIRCEIDGLIHFAAYKSVPESFEKPDEYYQNNVCGTAKLLEWAVNHNVKKFVYSSSSAVYGDTENVPIVESESTNPISPYAKSKLFTENILKDVCNTKGVNCVSLRYFNVAGNISSGLFGDDLHSPAIIPSILRAYFQEDVDLEIYGNNYNTKDGTPVRDFVHILDLVEAHFKALEFLESNEGFHIFNIGTKEGYSLLELIETFEEVVGENLKYEIKEPREGDIPISIADSSKAKELLGWQPQRALRDIFTSMLKYYESQGFRKE